MYLVWSVQRCKDNKMCIIDEFGDHDIIVFSLPDNIRIRNGHPLNCQTHYNVSQAVMNQFLIKKNINFFQLNFVLFL